LRRRRRTLFVATNLIFFPLKYKKAHKISIFQRFSSVAQYVLCDTSQNKPQKMQILSGFFGGTSSGVFIFEDAIPLSPYKTLSLDFF
jgi:hypothetical protein